VARLVRALGCRVLRARAGVRAAIRRRGHYRLHRGGPAQLRGRVGQAAGRTDSLTWFARSRVGDLGAFLGGGRAARDSAGYRVAVDSLAVLAAGTVWLLEQPAEAAVTDSTASVTPLAFRDVSGDGRVRLSGDLPPRGPANARLELQGVPLAGVVGLLQFDTAGVGGALDGTLTPPARAGSR
jgi:hypothetical protein